MFLTNEDCRLPRRSILHLLACLPFLGGSALAGVAQTGRNVMADLNSAGTGVVPGLEGVVPAECARYLEQVSAKLATMTPSEIASHVHSLAQEDANWRRKKCLNLRAAEGVMSTDAMQLLASTIALRVSPGFPGAKSDRSGTDRYIEEIEATVIFLGQQLFHAKYVEWRSTSNTMANAMVLQALTEPGDVIMYQSAVGGGGNASYTPQGPGGLKRLSFVEIPAADYFQFDLHALRRLAREVQPKFLFIGGSDFVLPFPVAELREIAREVGAQLVYDAAHVGVLIAGGVFQQPLDEGADIVTVSTHKTFGGPVGGLVLMNDPDIARKILHHAHNGFVQTPHQNKSAAAAYAMAEVAEFGREYARQTVSNAQTLAGALDDEGFKVLAKDSGYTRTHQVILDVRERGAVIVLNRCVSCSVLLQTAPLLGDGEPLEQRSGLRLSVGEITRLGMKQKEMKQVANFIRRAADGGPSVQIAREVEDFLQDFQKVRYSFQV